MFKPPTPEIPKAHKNRAKLNPICEYCLKLLNFGNQNPKIFGKKLAPSSILREAKIAYYAHNMFEAGRFFFVKAT